jgi:AhpD family alkylhydroperoxidase
MRIGLPMRERIALHVSAINRCVVCSAVHGVVGRMAGLSNDEISAAGAEVEPGLDRRTRTALRYAELRTTNREDAYPEDVESFERLFEKAEREEVEAVVDFLTFFNHLNNTWESLLPGAEARRACRHPQPSGHSWHKSI